MLFFVRGGPNDDVPRPTGKEFLQLVVKEWETVIRQRDEGKVVGVYGFTEGKGGIVIYDVGSRDEVDACLSELPLDPYASWEVIPLMSAETALEKTRRKLADGS
jgi:muconolactone delta-isomerase